MTTPVFACSDCGERNVAAGNCSRCGEGPLVDASRPEVKDVLWRDDERRVRKRELQLLPVAIVATVSVVFGVAYAMNPESVILMLFGGTSALMTAAGLAVVAFVVWKILGKALPARRLFTWL